jgi:glutamate racemase
MFNWREMSLFSLVRTESSLTRMSVIQMMAIRNNQQLARSIVRSLALAILLIASHTPARTDDRHDALKIVRTRDSITILVTDSGLGGLSVNADIARRALTQHCYRSIRLVFVNAMPGSTQSYNQLPTLEEKARVFSAALAGMCEKVNPDVVLIACNTLSVVYPATAFARTTSIPIVGIVDIGAQLMAERLSADTSSRLLIVGTETTIGEDAHRKLLRLIGIKDERMTAQACPDLAGEIQTDPASDVVRTMVEMYVSEGVARLRSSSGPIVVGLCCTHYGYVSELFASAVLRETGRTVEVIDPNMTMADALFDPARQNRFGETSVTQQVLSRTSISTGEIESIARLLEPISAQTASALRGVEVDVDLFTIPEHP